MSSFERECPFRGYLSPKGVKTNVNMLCEPAASAKIYRPVFIKFAHNLSFCTE